MRKLGKYELLGELGRGAFGVVYRARDPIINRMVALKTMSTNVADNPGLLERFYREAQSAGSLQHPNIITIFDMGDEGGTPFIAMELVDGQNLDDMITSRPALPLALKLSFASQACSAFDYAHKRGIIHRDIKPGNVMVSKEGTVKVVDFGIARVLETSKTLTGMLIGTFSYMAPEVFHGEHANERSDIWSFGVLMYELLAYRRPFGGESPAALMQSICLQEPTPLRQAAPDVPEDLGAVVQRALRKEQRDRYQSMEEMFLELDPIRQRLQSETIAELLGQSRQLVERRAFEQARETLRQALQVDPGNVQTKALWDKVSAELKRISLRPKAQEHVDKGHALLEQGRLHDAGAEAENALHLDSCFEPAQDLLRKVQEQIQQAKQVNEWLQACKQRLIEGLPEEAENLLARVRAADPSNRELAVLERQVADEKALREQRVRFFESMKQARALWTRQKYQECIELLQRMEVEFPCEEEVARLLETAREDQAEQAKQERLAEARSLLATRRYEECIAILVKLQGEHSNDDEVRRLLQTAREDQTQQDIQDRLLQARKLLANRKHEACIALLVQIQEDYPDDDEVARLLETARDDQSQRELEQKLAEARNLLSERRYEECIAVLVALEPRFPGEDEVRRLLEAAREDRSHLSKQERLTEARNLLAASRYEECISLLTRLQSELPGDPEVQHSLETARERLQEFQKQSKLTNARNLLAASRYEECIGALSQLQQEFADDEEITKLLVTVRQDRAKRSKQERLIEARSLLTARRYEQCIALLSRLEEESVGDSDIRKLLETARAEQAEQKKQKRLSDARKLLAARRYEQCIDILSNLQQEFGGDADIGRLLDSARQDEAEQRRREKLGQARKLLSARRYEECIGILSALRQELPEDDEVQRSLDAARQDQADFERKKKLGEARDFVAAQRFAEAMAVLEPLLAEDPEDSAVLKLRSLVEREQEKQAKAETLRREWEALKQLVSEKSYSEVVSRAEALMAEFPTDADLKRLIEFARTQQAQSDRELGLSQSLDQVHRLMKSSQFAEAASCARAALEAFPGNPELTSLLEQAEAREKKELVRQLIERRVREIKVKINRGQLSEAKKLAQETLVTLGPDTDVQQLLTSAEVEYEAREKKERQQQQLESVRTLFEAGKLTEATVTLGQVMKSGDFDVLDPRVYTLAEEIEAARKAVASTCALLVPEAEAPTKEYALLEGPLMSAGASAASPPPAQPPKQEAPPAQTQMTQVVGWQEDTLHTVEKQLASFIGPLARVIVKKAASKTTDPDELYRIAAASLEQPADREAFLASRTQSAETPQNAPAPERTHIEPAPPAAQKAPAADLTPAVIDRAGRTLARYVGPISLVLAKKAAKRADSEQALYKLLAEHVDGKNRGRFLRDAGLPES